MHYVLLPVFKLKINSLRGDILSDSIGVSCYKVLEGLIGKKGVFPQYSRIGRGYHPKNSSIVKLAKMLFYSITLTINAT